MRNYSGTLTVKEVLAQYEKKMNDFCNGIGKEVNLESEGLFSLEDCNKLLPLVVDYLIAISKPYYNINFAIEFDSFKLIEDQNQKDKLGFYDVNSRLAILSFQIIMEDSIMIDEDEVSKAWNKLKNFKTSNGFLIIDETDEESLRNGKDKISFYFEEDI